MGFLTVSTRTSQTCMKIFLPFYKKNVLKCRPLIVTILPGLVLLCDRYVFGSGEERSLRALMGSALGGADFEWAKGGIGNIIYHAFRIVFSSVTFI